MIRDSSLRMRRLIIIFILCTVLLVMGSEARPVEDSLFTACLTDLSNRSSVNGKRVSLPQLTSSFSRWYYVMLFFIIIGKSPKSTPRLSTSEISSFAFESFVLGISYIWHLEILDAIDKVERNLYRIESKINKLLDASYSAQREQEDYTEL